MPKLDLSKQTVKDLKSIAKQRGLKGYSRLKRDELLHLLREKKSRKQSPSAKRKGPAHYLIGFKSGKVVLGSSIFPGHSAEKRKLIAQKLHRERPDIEYKIYTAKQHEKLFGPGKKYPNVFKPME